MRDFKNTATAIHLDNVGQAPAVTLALTASALNSTEFVSGFSSHQSAFGRAYTISEEDRRLFAQLGDPRLLLNLVIGLRLLQWWLLANVLRMLQR